ncbi:hypothetical protein WJX72_004996 [[Myrmecia] bisecta]|uniref:Uncharacterized protein n=1 Tax=[Myrmecia] bisecta TaxID=41462 RepID=A0AAW1PMP1_9CHLO
MSPLSALPAVGILTGFGSNFMTAHAFGRGTAAVPVAWIEAVVPGGRFVLRFVRTRNRAVPGKADHSGQHAVEAILHLAESFWQVSPFMLQRYGLTWWALGLPAVRATVGSPAYCSFEQEVHARRQPAGTYRAHWSARPPSPELAEAVSLIRKQVDSVSEQVAARRSGAQRR